MSHIHQVACLSFALALITVDVRHPVSPWCAQLIRWFTSCIFAIVSCTASLLCDVHQSLIGPLTQLVFAILTAQVACDDLV